MEVLCFVVDMGTFCESMNTKVPYKTDA